MIKKPIKLLIVDIKILLDNLVPIIKNSLIDNNIRTPDCLESFVDYCLFRSISDVFLTPVTNVSSSYAHELIYCQLKNTLHPMLTSIVNFSEFRIFYGEEVKAISNGRNLFITTFENYE